MVLALSIFALLGTILYGAFALGHSALAKSQSSAGRSQKQRSTADLLGSYVRSAYPYRSSPQEQTIFFAGESDSLTFISAYSHGMGGRGMAKIQISARRERRWASALQPRRGNSGARQRRRRRDPDRLSAWFCRSASANSRLAYLDPQADEETWQERWDGQERRVLPRAVRLSFVEEGGGKCVGFFR